MFEKQNDIIKINHFRKRKTRHRLHGSSGKGEEKNKKAKCLLLKWKKKKDKAGESEVLSTAKR